MRFWDTSGVVALLADQPATREVRPVLEGDAEMAAWWGTPVECVSAVSRLRREGVLTIDDEESALDLLARLREQWVEILPTNEVRDEAMRLLRVHSLRATDALQLGAALVWTGRSERGDFVSLDERLALAARLEGMRVLP